ncbi:bifunctional 4-hydroxy-2-oxoglutarate aldolase/2-dehydro-3-deoxy-phosphogluconate aldolase [Mongoliibacter ruber]|uniref:2-dehydro-3-deoxyphosphogluconate aldolase/(4S)-4-hydroxy-2-oxoglutarate aldolase n=1 Tax=Mongoliibacter ruber TaxID=1750599 RepID=A0A2T0WV21_9BACT|nr:bifunctional 4-hydroxy-2-oxoglutarate aldolase/2-dehydro-3-deoxy-phosphogluconate aldolase [Mongoliibacter ruber]PRY90530.1 2-dehydro-3-deoxyphosphogluconate aldolase/(4S)-4-hydroxy-2-oxoglutarate aldolase [Mongoliibacter ruber]
MNEQKILDEIGKAGLVPLFTHKDLEIAKKTVDTCYEAGIRVFEYTNRLPNSFEVFKSLKLYAEKYPDLIFGIGTIFTVKDAERYLYAGADFIISPAMIPDVAHYCFQRGVTYIPGCATISEVYQAITTGSALVKIFPGNVLGPAFVKSVLSVLPDVKLMATGGVSPDDKNLKAWFDSGVFCVGMGSQLFDSKEMEAGNFEGLKNRVIDSLNAIQKIKQ